MHGSQNLYLFLHFQLQSVYSLMFKCVISVGGNQIENVNSFSHLGHIINSRSVVSANLSQSFLVVEMEFGSDTKRTQVAVIWA